MSMSTFVPGNISCIFRVHKGFTYDTTGSTGVGFTINQGATVTVKVSQKTEVFFNSQNTQIPPVLSIVKKLTKKNIQIFIKSELPLGGGFGLSGAATLATAYAVNDLLHLQEEKIALAKLSHIAEVENGTGLGDITNEYYGGFLLKTKPSFMFKVIQLSISNMPVFCRFISPIVTKSIIQNSHMYKKIEAAGKEAIEKVVYLHKTKTINFEKVIAISKEFALRSGLLTNREIMEEIKEIERHGGYASMIMLGNGIFSNVPFKGSTKYLIPKIFGVRS